MIGSLLCAVLAAAPAQAPGGGAEKPKLLVLDLEAPSSTDPQAGPALTEAIAAELDRRGYFQLISQREVKTLVGMERQKQLLGCNDEGASCLAEITGALGARFVLSGTLARLGDTWQLSLQLLDTVKARTVGRATRMAPDLSTLQKMIPWAVADVAGIPLPPPPSKVLPYSLIAAGAVAAVGGGVLGMDALASRRSVQDELARGQGGAALTGTYGDYLAQSDRIRAESLVAGGLLVAGAALLTSGILVMPEDPVGGSSGAHVALYPGLGGVSLAGAF